MKKEPRIGHYVPRMIEEWKQIQSKVRRKPTVPSGVAIDSSCGLILNVLEKAVCYTVTEAAFPLVWQTDLASVETENQRLPYPVMAIEYDFDYGELGVPQEKLDKIQELALKRIILLVEISDTQFALMSAYHPQSNEVQLQWAVAPISIVFTYEMLNTMEEWYFISDDLSLNLGIGGPGQPSVTAALPMFEDTVSDMDSETAEIIMKDMADELRVAFGMLGILSCSNAPIEKVAPPAKLNKKREKAGKAPIPTYRTLHVTDHTSRSNGSSGGSHSSPRTHWRRGHIRNQPTAKGVIRKWIKPTIIGGGDAPKPEVVLT